MIQSQNRKYKKRAERLAGYIKNILQNKEIDEDGIWLETPKAQAIFDKLVREEQGSVIDSLELDALDDCLVVLVAGENFEADLPAKVKEHIKPKKGKISRILLLFCIGDMRSRVRLEKMFDRKAIRAIKRELKGGGTIQIESVYILNPKDEPSVAQITGIKRYDVLYMPELEGKINSEAPEKPEAKSEVPERPAAETDEDAVIPYGMVCTVQLFQLVEIYNKFGDSIFCGNVRYGLREEFGVDQSIEETLEKEPDRFWFKNNGITLLLENGRCSVQYPRQLKMERFSVINGAQTITAAARFFFSQEQKEKESTYGSESEKQLQKCYEKAKEAKVLLRVISIPDGPEAEVRKLGKEISVALNRQKPIRMEDIAFTLPFAEKMARYLARRGEPFLLVRRGEESDHKCCMDLVSFARARAACAGQPGAARAKGAKQLLAYQESDKDGQVFTDKAIFVPGWLEREGEDEEDQFFRQHYQAVHFANALAAAYDTARREYRSEKADAKTRAILANGKWYFTALAVQLLNGFPKEEGNLPDFTNFPADSALALMKKRDLGEGMQLFAQMVLDCSEEEKINSNLFKSDATYKTILNQLREALRFGEEGPYYQFASFFEATSEPSAEADMLTLYLKEGETNVEAMLRTLEFVLGTYLKKQEFPQELCKKWIRPAEGFPPEPVGYFSARREVSVGEDRYWVGVHSNSSVKRAQLRQLCGALAVPPETIFWIDTAGRKEKIW